ncbi:MAG: ABC transporter ATP-binding protein [Dehalococcoidia bacterium]|jgi:putative ABC transport system ATP-binding protein
MNNIVTVNQLTKTLGNIRIIDHVSFNIEKGEFLAVQGPSGSGKTTLIGLLAGLEKADEGNIVIDDNELTSMTEDELAIFRRYNVGFVFQSFNLIPTLNVVENIALPLFPEHISRNDMFERARKVAKTVGLTERLDHYPNELSGGEQQRVAVARSLINEPKLIFADEPTGNLDSKTGQMIIELLRKLNSERGQTVVLVTHDDRIAKESDRIIKLLDGRIAYEN